VFSRVVLAAGGCVLVAMLAVAWGLTPDARGMGTHQQLGLAPCTVVQWFGQRCPSCGMTTAWAHLARGQVVAALRANAGGAVLAACALFMGPWLLASAATGRWVITPPRDLWLFMTAMIVAAMTLTQWALRLSLGW
jgi:hypothetical protein